MLKDPGARVSEAAPSLLQSAGQRHFANYANGLDSKLLGCGSYVKHVE